MICRMWHGWTSLANADAYDSYLRNELFPHLESELTERGYRGFHLLRLARDGEVEFVTMLWFESLEAVHSFAGEECNVPVISEKAGALLSGYAKCVDHFELSGFRWPNPDPN